MRVHRLAWVGGAVALLAAVVVPTAVATHEEVTVPTAPGQTATVTWEGTVLPGVQPASECGAADVGADAHDITILVPDGTYDSVLVTAVASIAYEGANDLIVTVVMPDGSTVSGDQGFVNTPESASFANPAPGTYTVLACMFAGATPQPYSGTLELSASAPPVAPVPCTAPTDALAFTEPDYVDTERAGGEPSVRAHPNGTLLYAAHAGTTHFYTPEAADETTSAFVQHYRGQVYAWFSDDDGATWQYVERQPPLSGFSDPDFAIDAAGNVFLSEINLVNVAVSRSPATNAGREYALQNFFGFTLTDRQWKEAGPEDMVFMVGNASGGGTFPTDPVGSNGHIIIRSTDGGQTFSEAVPDAGGHGDLAFDHGTATLYEAHLAGGVLAMAAFRDATNIEIPVTEALTPEEIHPIAEGVDMLSHWPAIDVDSAGNVYIAWDEGGNGARDAGVWYSYSSEGGRSWAAPIRVDEDDRTDIWPWIAVGDPGRVAVAWFGNDASLPDHEAQQAGPDDGWNVYVAQTDSGLGCTESPDSGFRVTQATPEAFHTGTVCTGGTACQAQLIDRRLGDYFVIDIDTTGAVVVAYSDTRQGGAVALPAFLRQTGGPSFFGDDALP